MKFSTKGIYGLQAMLDLAVHCREGTVVLKSIAERQGLSESYLEQLFAVLKKAKLVKSVRGAQGGYSLADCAERITVGQILRALEGPVVAHKCAAEKGRPCSTSYNCCITKNVFERIEEGIYKIADSITLAQLAQEFEKDTKNDNSG